MQGIDWIVAFVEVRCDCTGLSTGAGDSLGNADIPQLVLEKKIFLEAQRTFSTTT
jgi:hypothetical protein